MPTPPSAISKASDQFYADRFSSISQHAVIINNSFGFEGLIVEPIYSSVVLADTFAETVRTMAQEGVDDADKVIYVWSAGNSHGRPVVAGTTTTRLDAVAPNLLAGLPYHLPALTVNSIAVVAVRPNGRIAAYSNRCGVAAHFCIAAPGGGRPWSERIWVPTSKRDDAGQLWRGYGLTAGTSIAAPYVSGALALLMEAFPSLGSTEIAARLLATATRTGIYAQATIYGAGLLNLEAALAPAGTVSMLSGTDLEGRRAPIGSSRMTSAPAFGDALSRAMRGVSIAAYDELDAPFMLELEGLLEPAAPAARLLDRFAPAPAPARTGRMLAGGRLAFGVGPAGWFGLRAGRQQPVGMPAAAFSLPHLSLLDADAAGAGFETIRNRRRLQAAVFMAADAEAGAPASAAAVLEYGSHPAGWLLQAGLLQERARFLGGRARGAFGSAAGRSVFAGIQAEGALAGGWRARAAVHAGFSRPSLDAGVLHRMSPASTSSWALAVSRGDWLRAGDSLNLALSQPLRIESGRARLQVSTGRTRYRQVITQEIGIDLRPSGRQIDLELAYAAPLGASGRWQAGIGTSRHPGHSRFSGRDYFLLLTASLDL